MSNYYKGRRTRDIYDPKSSEPFKLSRSKIDNFLNCPRCFYIDRRLGIDKPPGFPFNLNSAVDFLLKKEFDVYRRQKMVAPLVKEAGLDLIPFFHPQMHAWRENFVGVQALHEKTNLLITGAVDDLWVDKNGVVYVVDYKATSKDAEVSLEADWQIGYKRQMEIYQWLLRKNGLEVSDTGYFVYCNGRTDLPSFSKRLDFDVKLIPYIGDDFWVEKTIADIWDCLQSDKIPESSPDCDYCLYSKSLNDLEGKKQDKLL